MRIAAGVLLIIFSLLHGCSGAVFAGVGAMSETLSEKAQEGAATDAEREEIRRGMEEVKDKSGVIVLIGVALLVLFGLELAAAICLFTQKAAGFIIGVGILGVLLGLAQIFMGEGSGAAKLVIPMVGIAVSLLAIVAARGMAAERRPGASAPPPPPPAM